MTYTIEEIASITTNKSTIRCEGLSFSNILIDSRKISSPNKSIFFAFTSASGNGHDYIPMLYKAGVKNFVITCYSSQWDKFKANFIRVEDTLTTLQEWATFHRNKFKIPVIGITGSNGKTIIKEWLYQLLQKEYKICRSPKSYNSQIGVALSLLNLKEDAEMGIFEAGISTLNEMDNLEEMIHPTIGIFSNLGQAHQEGFSSEDEKLKEKLQLFKQSKCLVFHRKYKGIEHAIKTINPTIELLDWELKNPNAKLNILSIKKQEKKSLIHYQVKGETAQEIILPFTDEASIENGIHTLACCLHLGIHARTENLEAIGMRLEIKEGKQQCLLIDDSYNSDINSLSIALDFLNEKANNRYTGKCLILSDMAETGLDPKSLYYKIEELRQEKKINRFIGIGPQMLQFRAIFPENSEFFPSSLHFIQAKPLFKQEAILIKGARKFALEALVSNLEEKKHETVLEINLSQLIENYKALQNNIRPETKVIAMLKANAYGCGAIEIAQSLAHHHCDYFGVAVADEGVELRKAGIHTPIIVMNPEPSCFNLLLEYHLEPEIYSFSLLKAFADYTDQEGISSFPIHIKIDTGMNRLGFCTSEVAVLSSLLQELPAVQVQSVFSHLVGSDNPDLDNFTQEQISLFTKAKESLQASSKQPILAHILNTAGNQRFPEAQFDMVRLGIGLYINIARLKTIILQIKEINTNETVGYNRMGRVNKVSRIASLPIGYADGLNRQLGNHKAYVMLHGKKAPYIGNICMDICMIDVSDIPEAKEGDHVIVFGEAPTIVELADSIDTIPYEILANTSNRVKRIYYQE